MAKNSGYKKVKNTGSRQAHKRGKPKIKGVKDTPKDGFEGLGLTAQIIETRKAPTPCTPKASAKHASAFGSFKLG